ncbi:MAG: phosphonate C-P lyase system protein PhnH [Actinobacteria bacterium]|nr:MAG: phosphonate C-P lyase system protein PhnH [Actinomycetota bacterium]
MIHLSLTQVQSHEVFRSMLDSLSRPGTISQLTALESVDVPRCIIPILAIVDVETRFSVIDNISTSHDWSALIGSATGAPPASLAESSWVVAFSEPTRDNLEDLPRGSALAPERGCCLVVACALLSEGFDHGDATQESTSIALTGPGVDGQKIVTISGISNYFFESLCDLNGSFPAGVDVWMVDQSGQILALSRSTQISILAQQHGGQ